MSKLITVLFIVVAIIHLLPLSGVIGSERLVALYGIEFNDSNVAILMRHRAILFGLLGALLLYAAFKPTLQPLAWVAGFISVISFLVLSWPVGDYNGAIKKVVLADAIALVCLLVALIAYVIRSRMQ